MEKLTRTKTYSLLKVGILTLFGLTAGLSTLSGCTSPAEKRVNSQETLTGSPSSQDSSGTNSVLLNHKQSALYQNMLRQGNYSDAAILESFQYIQPLQSNPSSLFTNISATPIAQSPTTNRPSQGRRVRHAPQLTAAWHTNVGWTLVLDGNYRGAEAAYRQALRQNAKSAKAYLGLGMALNLQGDRQKAITAYEKAVTLQPNYAAALVHLGYAYTEGNTKGQNIAKARTLFTQASELGDPFALLALLDLQGRNGSA